MLISDYHIHSEHSFDSDITVENLVINCIENGVNEVALTDHIDYNESNIFVAPNYQKLKKDVDQIRKKIQGKITVRLGLELGMDIKNKDGLFDYIDKCELDYIIGSLHKYKNYLSIRLAHNEESSFNIRTGYFTSLLEHLITFKDYFDCVGHLDFVTRYSLDREDGLDNNLHLGIFKQIAEFLVKTNKGIEINAAAYALGWEYPHPNPVFMKEYKKAGGKIITIGSDSHHPNKFKPGYKWGKCIDYLKSFGFEFYSTYEKRQPIFHKI